MAFAFYLRHFALAGGFIGALAQKLGSVAKAAAAEMIVLNLHHKFGGAINFSSFAVTLFLSAA